MNMNRVTTGLLTLALAGLFLIGCGQQEEISDARFSTLIDTLQTEMEYSDWRDFAWELAKNYPDREVAANLTVQAMERAIYEQDGEGFDRLFAFLQDYPETGLYSITDKSAIADRMAWIMVENTFLVDRAINVNEFSIKMFEANDEDFQWRDQLGSSVYDTRGKLLSSNQDHAGALAAYNKAAEFGGNADLYLHRAQVYEAMDSLEAAMEDYISVLGMAPAQTMIANKVQELYKILEPEEDDMAFMKALFFDLQEMRKEEVLGEMFTQPTPDFSLVDNNGREISKTSAKGKVVFMDFWATWCNPCRRTLPEFQHLYYRYKDDDRVIFVAASTDRQTEKVKPYIEENGYRFPYALASEAATKFGVEAIPSLFILGPNGNIRYKIVGFDPDRDFMQEMTWRLESLLPS